MEPVCEVLAGHDATAKMVYTVPHCYMYAGDGREKPLRGQNSAFALHMHVARAAIHVMPEVVLWEAAEVCLAMCCTVGTQLQTILQYVMWTYL